MLAAIVPSDEQAWFIKAVGSKQQLDAVASRIKAFFASVGLRDGQPTWELPEDWTEQSGEGMRLATLVVPGNDGSETELSVIGLPKTGSWPGQVLENVNRWRGQMGLSPTDAEGLAAASEPLPGAGDDAASFDLTGWFDAASAPSALASPAKPPRAATPPAAAPPRPSDLRYDTPKGWTEKPGSAMRKASFETPTGAEVTAFAFPNVAAMAEPLANVNRWRAEVGLPPTTGDDLPSQTEEIELLGGDGEYFDLRGEEETTFAAMTVRPDRVWFFKLRGPSNAVDADRDAFRAWLASIKLNTSDGGD